MAADEPLTWPLSWKSDGPIWVNQWLLSQEKLEALEELVKREVALGHLRPSTSPWNSPVFLIKKTEKWCFLCDLRKVNASMQDMGALQPGLLVPSMIPQDWQCLVIDLKDCFFSITLVEQDKQRFVQTVPSVNNQAPAKWYEWTVLPQGMKNSPTICQMFVARALQPVRKQYPQLMMLHYMDDILVAGETLPNDLENTITQAMEKQGLAIGEEKTQRTSPWKYLGTRCMLMWFSLSRCW